MSSVLAKRLLLSRRDLDMTQAELAKRAGNVSAAYISDLERNKISNPTVEVIEAISIALAVSPAYLLGWTDDPLGEEQPESVAENRVVYEAGNPEQHRIVQELLEIFAELSPPDQHMLMDLAERLRRAGTNAR